MAALIALGLLIGACGILTTTTPPINVRTEATGAPGPEVTAYEFANPEYFEESPPGVYTIRPAYQNTIAITCYTGWGRSCAMKVGVPKGAACTCKTVWGLVPGNAS